MTETSEADGKQRAQLEAHINAYISPINSSSTEEAAVDP